MREPRASGNLTKGRDEVGGGRRTERKQREDERIGKDGEAGRNCGRVEKGRMTNISPSSFND